MKRYSPDIQQADTVTAAKLATALTDPGNLGLWFYCVPDGKIALVEAEIREREFVLRFNMFDTQNY